MPSQHRLRELFDYDPHTGTLIRRVPTLRQPIGTVCGTPHGQGHPYKVVRMGDKNHFLHRLVWIYIYGHIPTGKNIDHINGDPTDNRLSNLRVVTQRENLCNRRLGKNNSSGFHGVQWHKAAKKWQARIAQTHLGLFSNIRDAVEARRKAEQKLNYHPNHGKSKGGAVAPPSMSA